MGIEKVGKKIQPDFQDIKYHDQSNTGPSFFLQGSQTDLPIRLVEKIAILAPVGGKIRFHGAKVAAGSPDFRTYFNFSLSQKLTCAFGF